MSKHRESGEELFDAAISSADIELRQFMKEVVRGIRYEDYSDLRVEEFRSLRSLVTMDRFSTRGENLKAEKIGVEEAELEELRGSFAYERMVDSLEVSWEQAVKEMSLSDVIGDTKMRNARARRLQRIATLASDPKANMKAMEMLAEREMPTKIPDKTGDTKIIMIQGGHAELMEVTADKELKEIRQKQLVDVTPDHG